MSYTTYYPYRTDVLLVAGNSYFGILNEVNVYMFIDFAVYG